MSTSMSPDQHLVSAGATLRLLLASVAVATCLVLAASPSPASPRQGAEPLEPDVSQAAVRLLDLVNTANQSVLLKTPGLTEAVVKKVMDYRQRGGKFPNLGEFRRVTGLDQAGLEAALKPYQDAENLKAAEAARKPVPSPPPAGKAAGRPGPQAGPPAQPQGQAGPIGAVRPGYYAKLPGYEDLDTIDPVKRTEFLERINRELCTCGCQNETLAFCLVNDPGCPVVKARVKKIYDDIMNKPPR